LSPDSPNQDLKVKYEINQEAGTGEYRAVFPGERVVAIFLLEEGKYQLLAVHYTSESEIPVHSVPGFSIPGSEGFEW
jgi:hypothetical protein